MVNLEDGQTITVYLLAACNSSKVEKSSSQTAQPAKIIDFYSNLANHLCQKNETITGIYAANSTKSLETAKLLGILTDDSDYVITCDKLSDKKETESEYNFASRVLNCFTEQITIDNWISQSILVILDSNTLTALLIKLKKDNKLDQLSENLNFDGIKPASIIKVVAQSNFRFAIKIISI